MNHGSFERVNVSFLRSLTGQIATPVPTVRLIGSRGEFSRFLQDRTLFFDGRFAFYEGYESDEYFRKYDLIALLVCGEYDLESVERVGNLWHVALKPLGGDNHSAYFLTVEKCEGAEGAVLR